ncbi:MAG: hypothetical protein M1822_006241 [Bathelium mastoideum]|nr:MAG: hypothetical protein M1822_006241 [Bathelium mastoideum]
MDGVIEAKPMPAIVPTKEADKMEETNKNDASQARGWQFWTIFPGLCLTSVLTALDSTILSTALPTIVGELHSASSYVWTINAYTLTFTAAQPFYGQFANLFGRKAALSVAIAVFMLGSIICGVAKDTTTLIAGRAVQGIGGGGLSILPAMVVCDLVPLRERQKYTGFIYGAFAIGTFIGPVIGGALVQHVGWRWVFWINLPVAGFALGLVLLFLKVHHGRERSILDQLLRIDYLGNAILVAAVTAILLALSGASTNYSWGSWHTLLPLLLGLLGLFIFASFEASSLCKQPTTPPRLFTNRTSGIAFALTFLHGVILYWASYFMPVYFQAVREASPEQSGINTLPAAIPLVPFGILGGIMIAKTGRYKLNQMVGFVLAAVGIGCFPVLDRNSSTATWAILQIIFAAGAGFILTATMPAIQAPLPESDVASATAAWGFVQSLGFICGLAIPSSIFDTRFSDLLGCISDPSIRQILSGGGTYEHASRTFVSSLNEPVKTEVIDTFVASLKLVWQVGSAFAGLGLVISAFIGEVKLRESLDTKYGYKDQDVPRANA